jgi:hypothetical protein
MISTLSRISDLVLRISNLNAVHVNRVHLLGFPHSDIFGSKVARHLPEAYRRHAASFIAFSSQGIHHTPLNFLLGNLKTALFTYIAYPYGSTRAIWIRPSSSCTTEK